MILVDNKKSSCFRWLWLTVIQTPCRTIGAMQSSFPNGLEMTMIGLSSIWRLYFSVSYLYWIYDLYLIWELLQLEFYSSDLRKWSTWCSWSADSLCQIRWSDCRISTEAAGAGGKGTWERTVADQPQAETRRRSIRSCLQFYSQFPTEVLTSGLLRSEFKVKHLQ